MLLIADEVITGFGRTGAAFGSHRYGIEPDLITVAKGLTSAYVPMSAVLIGESVWSVMAANSEAAGPFSHGYTYSGHPLAAAAANAVLDIVERENLADKAGTVGAYLLERLRERFQDLSIVGEVRGVGMLAALEFVADRAAKRRFDPSLKVGARVSKACLERGLIARAMPHGDILGFAPPLVMNPVEVDEMIAIVTEALRAVLDALAREGVRTGV